MWNQRENKTGSGAANHNNGSDAASHDSPSCGYSSKRTESTFDENASPVVAFASSAGEVDEILAYISKSPVAKAYINASLECVRTLPQDVFCVVCGYRFGLKDRITVKLSYGQIKSVKCHNVTTCGYRRKVCEHDPWQLCCCFECQCGKCGKQVKHKPLKSVVISAYAWHAQSFNGVIFGAQYNQLLVDIPPSGSIFTSNKFRFELITTGLGYAYISLQNGTPATLSLAPLPGVELPASVIWVGIVTASQVREIDLNMVINPGDQIWFTVLVSSTFPATAQWNVSMGIQRTELSNTQVNSIKGIPTISGTIPVAVISAPPILISGAVVVSGDPFGLLPPVSITQSPISIPVCLPIAVKNTSLTPLYVAGSANPLDPSVSVTGEVAAFVNNDSSNAMPVYPEVKPGSGRRTPKISQINGNQGEATNSDDTALHNWQFAGKQQFVLTTKVGAGPYVWLFPMTQIPAPAQPFKYAAVKTNIGINLNSSTVDSASVFFYLSPGAGVPLTSYMDTAPSERNGYNPLNMSLNQNNSLTTSSGNSETTDFVGTEDPLFGDGIGVFQPMLEVHSNRNTWNGAQLEVCFATTFFNPPGGASTIPIDVNVVGFQTQSNPVWTSNVAPGTPVINLPTLRIRDTVGYYSNHHCTLPKDKAAIAVAIAGLQSQIAKRQSTNSGIDWTRAQQLFSWLQQANSFGSLEALAKLWNELMHALNGNTEFDRKCAIAAAIAKRKNLDYVAPPKSKAFDLHLEKVEMDQDTKRAEAMSQIRTQSSIKESMQLAMNCDNVRGYDPSYDEDARALNEHLEQMKQVAHTICDTEQEDEIPTSVTRTIKMPSKAEKKARKQKNKIEVNVEHYKQYMEAKINRWPTFNRFVLLESAPEYDWQVEAQLEAGPALVEERDSTPPTQNHSKSERIRDRKQNTTKTEDTDDKTPSDAANERAQANSIRRIAARVGTLEKFADWLGTRRPSVSFAKAILHVVKIVFGDCIRSWYIRAYICKDVYPEDLAMITFLRSKNFQPDLYTSDSFCAWFEDVWGQMPDITVETKYNNNSTKIRECLSQSESTAACAPKVSQINGSHGEATETDDLEGYKGVLARLWNALMHALNGNQAQRAKNSMADIRGLTSVDSLIENPGVGAKFDARKAVGKLSGLMSNQPVGAAGTLNQNYFRSITVANDNTTANATLWNPEAYLMPRELRGLVGGALAPSGFRTQWYDIATIVRNLISVPAKTAVMTTIEEAVMRAGWLNPKNITKGGFRMCDVLALGQAPLPGGDSMLLPFLKLLMIMHNTAWLGPTNALPIGMEMGKFNFFNALDLPAIVVLDYNNGQGLAAAVFGEDCGGPTSVFPWSDAAAQPSLYLVTSLACVPPDERANVIALHAILAQLNETGGASTVAALIIAAWSQYPSGIWTTVISTTDGAAIHDATSSIPFSSLVRMSGMQNIYILVPVVGGSKIPTTAAEAQASMIFPITFGPTASTAYPVPGANLPPSFLGVGGAINNVRIDLAQYLYTHFAQPASVIDTVTIVRTLTALARLTGKYKDLELAVHFSRLMCCRLPAMTTAAAGTPVIPLITEVLTYYSVDFMNRLPTVAQANFPTTSPNLHDYLLPEATPIWFTQVMIDAIAPVDDGGNKNWAMEVGGQYEQQWAMYEFRSIAVGAHALYRSLDYPVSVWNDMLNNTPFTFIRETLQEYFVKYDVLGKPDKPEAPMAKVWEAAVTGMTGRTVPVSSCGDSIFNWVCLPPGGFGGIVSVIVGVATVISGTVPTMYADIWLELARAGNAPVLEFCMFPPPLKMLSGISDDAMKVKNTNVGTTIPLTITEQYGMIGTEEDAPLSSKTRWNSRVVWHCGAALAPFLAATDGGGIPGVTVPVPGNLVFQRVARADATLTNAIGTVIQTSNTCWFPSMLNSGTKVAMLVPPPNQNLMTQIMAAVAFTTVPTWQYNGLGIVPNLMTGGGKGVQKYAKYRSKAGAASATAEEAKKES